MTTMPGLPSSRPPERSPVVGDIEQLLQAALAQMPRDDQGDGPGRPRILPSLCLWSGLLVCVLRGFTHHVALWRLLRQGEWWFYPRVAVSDEAVAQRLARAGTGPLAWQFVQIRDVLHARLAPSADAQLAPFASAVVALDETTLDPVARPLPILRDLLPVIAGCCPASWRGCSISGGNSGGASAIISTPTSMSSAARGACGRVWRGAR